MKGKEAGGEERRVRELMSSRALMIGFVLFADQSRDKMKVFDMFTFIVSYDYDCVFDIFIIRLSL